MSEKTHWCHRCFYIVMKTEACPSTFPPTTVKSEGLKKEAGTSNGTSRRNNCLIRASYHFSGRWYIWRNHKASWNEGERICQAKPFKRILETWCCKKFFFEAQKTSNPVVVSNVFFFSNGCFTPVCKRWPICDEDFIQIGWSKTTDLDTLEMTSCLTPSEIRYGPVFNLDT